MNGNWSEVVLPESWSLEVADEVDSTNAELKRRTSVPHGTVLLAESQTAGRGRRGAAWIAVPGESLSFSVAIRPTTPRSIWPRLALASGVAVAEALAKLGIEAEVKWPNDVLIQGRKLCGVLVEATDELAIVGIGLNVKQAEFVGDLKGVATSVHMEGRADVLLEDLLGLVLLELSSWTRQIEEGFPDLIARLRERCALAGKLVSLRASDGVHQGVVKRVGDRGELLLETDAGLKRLLQADEVRVIK